jgi:membrane associated rhomboid family serine protease
VVTIPREIYEILKSRERWPILTLSIVTLLIVVFALQQVQVVRFEDFGLIPAQASSKPWTFITSNFLHADVEHLFFNLLGLAYVGIFLESASDIRRKNILIAFIISGVAGSLAVLVVFPQWVVAIGASDAIFGLLGVAIFAAPYEFLPLALLWAAVGFIIDPAYASHIAGLLVGISLGIYWKKCKSQGFT